MEEDAYCLVMAFGSSVSADDNDDVGRGGREGASSAQKTIERRLEMLVSRINAAGGVDGSALRSLDVVTTAAAEDGMMRDG